MPISEDTINDLVADYLREEGGLDITTQTSGRVQAGARKPDFELHSAGRIYYGEGEWLRSYHRGLQQAIDFGDIPGASGYFLLGYPDDLKATVTARRLESSDPATLLKGAVFQRCLFKPEGKRADVRQVPFEGLHSWISSVLAPALAPPEPEEFLRLMRTIVDQLADYLPRGKSTSRLFEHVIATIPKQSAEADAARKGSAYLLLNQVVFYRILSEHRELGYLPMDPKELRSPVDVSHYFERVMLQDYHAIFQTNVIDLFPQRAFPFIRALVRLVSDLQPEEYTRTLLGSIFHSLIPLEVRKPVAAYYTNPAAAHLLVRLAAVSGSDKVADLACGSGTLLVAAYDQKARTDTRADDQARHAKYLEEEITGLDIMPFAAHMAVVQLALLNPVMWTNKVRVAVDDSTQRSPGDAIHSLERRAVSPQTRLTQYSEVPEPRERMPRGALSADGAGAEFKLEPADVVLMNPPFSRKQYITTDYRRTLGARFADYSKYVSNEMGLWGYFVLLADRFCRLGGRVALVLPVGVLRQESSSGLRRLLSERYDVEYIVLSGARSAFSEDAINREVLLISRRGTDKPKSCKAVMIHVPLTESSLDWVSTSILSGTPSNEIEIAEIPQDRLRTQNDWLSFIPSSTLGGAPPSVPKGALSPLREVRGARLIQGIRMESGSEFVNTEDTLVSRPRAVGTRVNWEVQRENSRSVTVRSRRNDQQITIPRSALAPSTRSITGLRRLSVDDPPDFVVMERFKGDEQFWSMHSPQAALLRRRAHVRSRMGRIVLAGYGNINLVSDGTSLLAVYSETALAPTWNCWSLRVSDSAVAKMVVLWWNSSFNLSYLLNHCSEVGGSLVKWRKQVIESAPVPNFHDMSPKTAQRLLETFEVLSARDFPPLLKQLESAHPLRLQLDRAVGAAIGLSPGEMNSWLRDFYLSLSTEFGAMKSRAIADSSS